jgi:hypothetical protein
LSARMLDCAVPAVQLASTKEIGQPGKNER